MGMQSSVPFEAGSSLTSIASFQLVDVGWHSFGMSFKVRSDRCRSLDATLYAQEAMI